MSIQRTLGWPVVRSAVGLLAAFVFFGLPAGRALAAPATAALAPVDGEVIVVFKPQGDTVRRYALTARATKADVQGVLNQRALALGGRVKRSLISVTPVGATAQVVRAEGVDAPTLARQLAADPDVAAAAPNGRKRRTSAPNDPLYAAAVPGVRPNGPDAGQWYLRAPTSTFVSAIDIEAAWAHTQGSNNVVVAVLDTGVRFDHPDLGRVATGGPLLPGYDFVSNTTVANDGGGRDDDASDPGDWITQADLASATFRDCPTSGSSWHGTATASLIAATTNNSVGMAGAAPGVRVVPVRVLGKCFGTDADIQAAMLWAAGISQPGVPDNPNPARVINMSLGGGDSCGTYQSVVDQIVARGVVIVAAAGNSAGGPVGAPANCQGVLGIAALRHAGSKVGFSDLGPEIALAAPGGNCVNTAPGSPCLYPILAATDSGTQGPAGASWTNSYDITVGTSFSAPLVAGVAALMVSRQSSLTVAGVRTVLQSTARPFPSTGADNGTDPTPVAQCHASVANVEQLQCYCVTGLCGAGMLDAGAALTALATAAPVTGPQARAEVSTASPTAGQLVSLTAANSVAGTGGALRSYEWALVSGGGIASAFSSATNGVTAALTPSAAGSFSVRLTVTDASGLTDTVTTIVAVAAAAVTTPVVPPATPAANSGGGGAASLAWVLGVLLAALLLAVPRRR